MENTYTPTDQERKAIKIMIAEKSNWQEGTVFITPKVAFDMKKVVEKCRKNYFGIFNQQNDPFTQREKIFIPLTEWTVETVLKNIDIDTKDIQAKAKNPAAYKIASIFRYVLRKKMDDINFGKTINKLIRRVCIDGTGFLKIYKTNGKLQIDVVDRLNLLYDPSAETLDLSSGITERNVLTVPEFKEYKWDNMEYVQGNNTIDRTGFDLSSKSNIRTEVPYVTVYERYGWISKDIITGDEKDKDDFVYALIVASGLESESSTIVHKIKEVKNHPYQEFKFKDVPNRLDGRGIAEMLFNIQAYLNEVVNTRLNKGRIVHLGLWKLRGNITPQQVSKLFTTSAIKLDAASDIEPLKTGSIDPSSYKDEDMAYSWGQKVTQSSMQDEIEPSKRASVALIEQQSSAKAYNLRIEDIFLNLEKAFREKIVPIINQELTKEEIVRITGDAKVMQELDEQLIRNYTYKKIQEMIDTGGQEIPDQATIDAMMEETKKEFTKMGEDRPFPIVNELFDTEYDITISITDETINKASMAQMLQNILPVIAQTGKPVDPVISELFDTLGLDGEKMLSQMNKEPQQPQGQPQGEGEQLSPEQQAGMVQTPPLPGQPIPR